MTIFDFSHKLQEDLKASILSVSPVEPISTQAAASLARITQDALQQLVQFVNQYTFKDQQEQIIFFKTVKPVILSQYFYYRKLFSIRLFEGYKEVSKRREFYEHELARMEQYARKHRAFFLYCMSGDTAKDQEYFTRNYSTVQDHRLAMMLSHELIRPVLLNGLNPSSQNFHSTLTWSGKKAELVELLFALHASGSIDGGKAKVKQILAMLEQAFNVDLHKSYDYLKNIRMRKNGTAIFLDHLKEQFLARLDQMDD